MATTNQFLNETLHALELFMCLTQFFLMIEICESVSLERSPADVKCLFFNSRCPRAAFGGSVALPLAACGPGVPMGGHGVPHGAQGGTRRADIAGSKVWRDVDFHTLLSVDLC